MGDIRFVEDRVEVDGPLKAKGEIDAVGGLQCRTGEIRSWGPVAGFSFSDRAVPADQQPGAPAGGRYVWYADKQCARLWSGRDLMIVSIPTFSRFKSVLSLPDGQLSCKSVVMDGEDLVVRLAALEKRLAAAEAKLDIAPPKPFGGNGRPAPVPR